MLTNERLVIVFLCYVKLSALGLFVLPPLASPEAGLTDGCGEYTSSVASYYYGGRPPRVKIPLGREHI